MEPAFAGRQILMTPIYRVLT